MKISLNGEKFETEADNLRDLCRALGFEEDAMIATAVDGDFVPKAARAGARLEQGCAVEIVAPRQGG